MTVEGSPDITRLLAAWSNGDEEALTGLMPLVYPALRGIARKHLSRQAAPHILESAALANEAYLKLVRARGLQCESRVQFFSLCAQIIRRILVDYARHRRNAKGGGGVVRVPLDEEAVGKKVLLILAPPLDSPAGVLQVRRRRPCFPSPR